MKVKVIDYLGNEKIYDNVSNIYFTKRGYRIEFINELGRKDEIWRQCVKFSSDLSNNSEFDHIINEW